MYKKFLVTFIALLSPLLMAFPAAVFAAGASISLSASRSTVAPGGTVIIAVYANGGGTPVNAVQVDMAYPASKLQYVGFSASGSAFEIGASSGGGDGSATLARGTTSSVSGSGLVGTVTFRALASSGSALISVAGSSSLVSDGNPVAYGSSGTSVTFGGSVAVPTASSPKATAAPAAPEPPKDTTPPVISAVKATSVTPYSATITWTTDKASDSVVDFGIDANYGLSSSVSAASTTHTVQISSTFLEPQTRLHYRVKSTDSAGNVATGKDATVQLPGVPVVVIIIGSDGRPQAGATVTLDGDSGTTDKAGRVTLHSSLGTKQIVSSFNGQTSQQAINVTKSSKPLPPVKLDFARQPLNHWMVTSAGLALLVISLLVIDAVLFGSRILARMSGLHIRRPATDPNVQPILPASEIHQTSTEPEVATTNQRAAPPEVSLSSSTASLVSEPAIDPEKTVAELMELTSASTNAPAQPPRLPSAPLLTPTQSHPIKESKPRSSHKKKSITVQ